MKIDKITSYPFFDPKQKELAQKILDLLKGLSVKEADDLLYYIQKSIKLISEEDVLE